MLKFYAISSKGITFINKKRTKYFTIKFENYTRGAIPTFYYDEEIEQIELENMYTLEVADRF